MITEHKLKPVCGAIDLFPGDLRTCWWKLQKTYFGTSRRTGAARSEPAEILVTNVNMAAVYREITRNRKGVGIFGQNCSMLAGYAAHNNHV